MTGFYFFLHQGILKLVSPNYFVSERLPIPCDSFEEQSTRSTKHTMSRHSTLFAVLVSVLLISVILSCKKEEESKPEAGVEGAYAGTATNKANSADKKPMSLTITSSGPPLAGTYTFNGASGKVTGSVLGLILNMTLKPNSTGTAYSLSATADDNDTSLSGTMTGVESSTSVTYTILLTK